MEPGIFVEFRLCTGHGGLRVTKMACLNTRQNNAEKNCSDSFSKRYRCVYITRYIYILYNISRQAVK